jgi:hypothetical protein
LFVSAEENRFFRVVLQLVITHLPGELATPALAALARGPDRGLANEARQAHARNRLRNPGLPESL